MARILITSALPSVNGVKHLGNLIGSMLPADVYARFCRARGHEVLAICATDDHGAPIELAAVEEGTPVSEYCDHWHAIQRGLGERFGLSWDKFGRTSAQQNLELTHHFARALWKNGHLDVRTTKQAYSATDGRFLPDRYVIGTCPHCGYDRARGDQCENCTRLLDPIDLIDPRSAVSGAKDIEIRESTHLFLKQSQFVAQLREWIGSKKDWPHIVTSIAYKWLDEGLEDRGITRDLQWGFPVPDDIAEGRLKGKVFYVWFDAPIGYISATKQWADEGGRGDAWKDWWFGAAAKDVTYVEFMGKDNVPFHTVGFPITIFGSGEPWKLVDKLKGFNWLNYQGGKFSTSQKRGIFMDQALEILPADYWRWYLLANAPEGSDSSFTWQHFQATVNKDLADVFGNFVNRILRFAKARFGETVPVGGAPGPLEEKLFADLESRFKQYTDYLEAMEFRKAAAELRALWVLGNEYLTEAAPWTTIKTDRDKAAQAVRLGINLIHFFAHAAQPFIPATAVKVHAAVNGHVELLPWLTDPIREELSTIEAGDPFSVPDVLFAKIEDSQVSEWEARFGGEKPA